MKNKLFLPLIVLSLVAGVVACSPKNNDLTGPGTVYNSKTLDGGDLPLVIEPKVDILFVVDTSESMFDDQQRISENIDTFAKEFAKNELVDFHIGIVSVFDRDSQKEGQPYFWPAGQLRPVKDPKATAIQKVATPNGECESTDEIVTNPSNNKPGFITRETPDWINALKASLKVGVQCIHEHYGPEFEEIFSPVASALSTQSALTPGLREGANAGFYRQDAHLAVIIITDADASHNDMAGGKLYDELVELKGSEDLISVNAVGIPSGDLSCERDPDLTSNKQILGQQQLHNFLLNKQSKILGLCPQIDEKTMKVRNFGDDLGKIGQEIRRHTVERTVLLTPVPDPRTIALSYGSQTNIPPGQDTWIYDPETHQVFIDGDIQLKSEPGAKFTLKFTPIHPDNIRNGRLSTDPNEQ